MKHEPNSDVFESRLAKLSPTEIDPTWRAEILKSASAEETTGLAYYLPKPLVAGLAACWIFIGALNFINRPDATQSELAMPAEPSPAAPVSLYDLQQQLHAMLATSNPGECYE